MRCLIVEDDFVSRRVLQAFLSPFGPCEVAVNGREALDAFRLAHEDGKPYDLICLDIMMPEMDGHAVLRELRGMEESKGIHGSASAKVIMTTALSDFDTIMASFRAQCEAYLVKPVDRASLLAKLEQFGLVSL